MENSKEHTQTSTAEAVTETPPETQTTDNGAAQTLEVSTEPAEGKKSFLPKWLVAVLVLVFLIGSGFATYTIVAGQRTINVGNARLTTDQVSITAMTPGLLERFDVYEGMVVTQGQILGWIQNGETFRSPVDGLVVNTNVSVGQQIVPMTPLATIIDTADIHVQANVYESDLPYIQLGQPVTITLDGLNGGRLTGYVRHIASISQQELAGVPTMVSTGTFRRVIQTFAVEVAILEDTPLTHLIGSNARASFPVLAVGYNLRDVHVDNGFDPLITATGRVDSALGRNVYSPHTLRIQDVLVSLGDTVQAGQVLATLDVADLETNIAAQRAAIAQARTHSQLQAQETQRMLNTARANMAADTNMNLINARANVTAAELQLDNAQRLYAQARTDYNANTNPQIVGMASLLTTLELELARLTTDHANMQTLYNAGALPRRDLDLLTTALTNVQTQHADALINYNNAREAEQRQLEQLQVALTAAQVAYNSAVEVELSMTLASQQEIDSLQSALRMAQIDTVEHLEYTLSQMERHLAEGVITAPVSGTITAVHAEAGEFSLARLFTIDNLEQVRVFANVREYDLPNIAVGQQVTATAYATGEQIHHGVVTTISPRAVQTVPVVQFEIEVAITSDNHNLRPGMSATVRIDTN